MTITPSRSIGSPNTLLTDMASRAPLSISSTFTVSLPFELGPPLVAERAQPLARVLRCEGEIQQPALVLEPELKRALERTVDRFLCESIRDGPFRRDVTGEPLCLLEPRLALDH